MCAGETREQKQFSYRLYTEDPLQKDTCCSSWVLRILHPHKTSGCFYLDILLWLRIPILLSRFSLYLVQCCAQVISVNRHSGGGGPGNKARELNADEWGSPCGPVLCWLGLHSQTEPAGLSAWGRQEGTEERPFLDTLSIGVLNLWTKSEFGAGKCCVQWPEQNERGGLGSIFSVCAFATGCNSFGCVSRMGNPEYWHAFYVRCGIQPRAGDRGLMEMTVGWGEHWPWEGSRTVGEHSAYGNKVGAQTFCFYSIAPTQHPPSGHCVRPLPPPSPPLCSALSSLAWILSTADFNSAIKLNIAWRGGKGRVLLEREIKQEEKPDALGLGIPSKRKCKRAERLMVQKAPLLLGVGMAQSWVLLLLFWSIYLLQEVILKSHPLYDPT